MSSSSSIRNVKEKVSSALSCTSGSKDTKIGPDDLRLYYIPNQQKKPSATTKSGDASGTAASDTKAAISINLEDREPLPDDGTISDHHIMNDSILLITFRKNPGDESEDTKNDDVWETLSSVKPNGFME